MNRRAKRLRLSVETIRTLTNDDLRVVAGGIIPTLPDTANTIRTCQITDGCWPKPPPLAPQD
jgi:hypothetical protein